MKITPMDHVYQLGKKEKTILQETVLGFPKNTAREVFPNILQNNITQPVHIVPTDPIKVQERAGEPNKPWTDVWKVEIQDQHSDLDPSTAQPNINIDPDISIFTRKMDAFMTAHIDAVVAVVHIGKDLNNCEEANQGICRFLCPVTT